MLQVDIFEMKGSTKKNYYKSSNENVELTHILYDGGLVDGDYACLNNNLNFTFLSILSEAVVDEGPGSNEILTTFLSNGGEDLLLDLFSINTTAGETLGEN